MECYLEESTLKQKELFPSVLLLNVCVRFLRSSVCDSKPWLFKCEQNAAFYVWVSWARLTHIHFEHTNQCTRRKKPWLKQTMSATDDDDDDNVCKYVFHSGALYSKDPFILAHAALAVYVSPSSGRFKLQTLHDERYPYVIATSQNDEMCKWHARML